MCTGPNIHYTQIFNYVEGWCPYLCVILRVSYITKDDLISTLFIYFLKFYFIFKLYNIVLVLPNIEINPPQGYMCSPS